MRKALKSLGSVLAASSLMFVLGSHGQAAEVKIGYLRPLSAENAPQGQQSKRAIDMAVEEING
jgi:ABC-type branched-subunit amino acid transport system substrate-binding protein